jgi:membrane-bound serine protease (ClpP class)
MESDLPTRHLNTADHRLPSFSLALVACLLCANGVRADAIEPKSTNDLVGLDANRGSDPSDAPESLSEAEQLGQLIRVPLPLTGNADSYIKNAIERAIDTLTSSPLPDGRRPVLLLELSPARRSDGLGIGSDFERAQSLARYLSTHRNLAAVKTVAYVPRTIQGHGVLVAMACEEIVMHPKAELGAAGADEDMRRPLEPVILSLYQQIAAARRTIPKAIALAMLDPRLELHKVETEEATEFVLANGVAPLEEHKTVIADDILVPTGALASFTGSEGRQYGFVKYIVENRAALARVLDLPAEAVREDMSLAGDWRPVMINIEGPITPRLVGQVQTLIAMEKDQRDVNWIGFRIDSGGGALEDCLELADTIASQDATETRTVAYVPVEASGGAALVALACDQVVVQPAASLGRVGADPIDRETLDAAEAPIRVLAEETDQTWSLLRAFIDPQLEINIYTNKKTGEAVFFSPQQVKALPDAKDWRKGNTLTPAGEPLTLTSQRLQQLGLVGQVVDNFDEFKKLYRLTEDPRVAKPNWALELVEALASPGLAIMLLVVGFLGIYLELHSPGFGIGGFVAAVAFMLFFWSKFLHGTATWLEILLFTCGLFFLLLEFFVLPGLGIFGIGGAVMVILSLLLASQTFVLPHSQADLVELRNSLAVLVGAGAGILVLVFTLRYWLPRAPILNKLLLNPPENEELTDLQNRESVANFSHLVGQKGTAATDLLPAGKAQIGDQLVDVIADGDIMDRGQAVMVTMARGNRIMVRAVDS